MDNFIEQLKKQLVIEEDRMELAQYEVKRHAQNICIIKKTIKKYEEVISSESID